MGQPKVTINIQNGGLATASTNPDVVSGLISYNSNFAQLSGVGITSGTNYAFCQVGSVKDAELFGILSTNNFSIEHFQIQQYFIGNPSAKLFLGLVNTLTGGTGATYTFEEIVTLQQYAVGQIVRFGVLLNKALATSDVNTLQGIVTTLYSINAPATIYYEPNTLSTSYLSLTDLRVLNDNQVCVIIGQDSTLTGGVGGALALTNSRTVSNIGLILGYKTTGIELNVGWVGGFNFQNANENYSMQIGNTQLVNITQSALDLLNDKGYIFMKQIVGFPGTYINDMPSASVLANNDYAYIPNSEVMYKAVRAVRAGLTPFINSKIKVNTDGTMDYGYIKVFENAAEAGLILMKTNDEISDYKVFINSNSNVVSTSTVPVTIKILPVGYSRYITVSIGFAAKL